MNAQPSPHTTRDLTDPGDDVQRRFRYQAAYAAVKALILLREDADFIMLYCEHYDDVLLCTGTHSFYAIQVKTRRPELGPFRSTDESIVSTLHRFAILESRSSETFSRYVIAAAPALWEVKRDGTNLPHLLTRARELHARGESLLEDQMIQTLCQKVVGEGSELLPAMNEVLLKLYIEPAMPHFFDASARVLDAIAAIPGMSAHPFANLERAANRLIDMMSEAASLRYSNDAVHYAVLSDDPIKKLEAAIIEGKRITRDKLDELIMECCPSMPTLSGQAYVNPAEMGSSTAILDRKLAAGGLSYQNVDLVRENRTSFEHLYLTWLHKYGSTSAKERYEHILQVVRNECQAAHDEVFTAEQLFGTTMMQRCRSALRARYSSDDTLRSWCSFEHLLGAVGSLTEMCKLWWSLPFELEGAA